MATNSILPFGATASNELSQAAYAADAQRLTGNQPGVARSQLVNKALHQTSVIAAGVAQFIADRQGADVVDTLTPAQVAAMLAAGMQGRFLGVQVIAASGTYTRSAGAVSGIVRGIGGGGGGGGTTTTGATQVSVGAGGASAAWFEHYFAALPATQAVVIGAAGSGGSPGSGGGSGGTTTFGALSAPGGNGGVGGGNVAPPYALSGGSTGSFATGGNVVNAVGGNGDYSIAITTGCFISGRGGASILGGGGASIATASANGNVGPNKGSGGSGAGTGTNTAGATGGAGGAGVVFVFEFGGA